MFNLLAIFSILFNIKEIVQEKFEKPPSKNSRFDYDAFYKDTDNGMSAMDQLRKRQRGDYITTKPLTHNKVSFNDVVDIKRYKNDIDIYGKDVAEIWRKNGNYKYIRNL